MLVDPATVRGLPNSVLSLPDALLSLKDAGTYADLDVLADAHFATLGFVMDSMNQMLSFLEDGRYLSTLRSNSQVRAVITTRKLASSIPSHMGIATSEDPRRTFFVLQNELAENGFYGPRCPTSIHSSARIHPRATVAEIGVEIGANVVIGANAVIETGTCLMPGAVVHPGAVLGATGFQTLRRGSDFLEMSHVGRVIVEEDAIVFANATIARGLFRQATRIGARCRIGNNSFISHNVTVGANSFVGHGAVVNGNSQIGSECWIGPGAVVANGVSLGDKAFVSLGSVVIGDLEPEARVSGNFAMPHQRFLRRMAQTR